MAQGSITGASWLSRARLASPPGVQGVLLGVFAGGLAGAVTVIAAISFAALIFSGALAPHLAEGIGIALVSAIVVGGLVAILSSYPGSVAIPQDRVAPILALMAGTIASTVGDDGQRVDTVITALLLSSMVTGLVLAGLGFFGLGKFIRFIPYPVVGGFLAGSGWLLVLGALHVLAAGAEPASHFDLLTNRDAIVRWVPGLALGVLLLVVVRRLRHVLALPAALLGAIALFYAGLGAAGVSVATASANGWLLGPFPDVEGWSYPTWSAFRGADWAVVLDQAPTIATVALVSAVSLLLNSTALEIAAREEMALDHEMRATGIANLVGGVAGGMTGFHSLSISTLALRVGGRGRLVGLVAAAMSLATLILGVQLLAGFPRVVLGGLLLFLGLGFLVEWVYDGWHRLSRGDYLTVLLILLTVGGVGYLEGVAVGIVASVVLFVESYSRVDVVKHELSGSHQRSNVDRPQRHERLLGERGAAVHILELQGFLFFGTANKLLDLARGRAADGSPLEYLVLDFHRVTGLDSSTGLVLVKLRQLADRLGFQIVFTGVTPTIERLLVASGVSTDDGHLAGSFPDLDRGLEWCEDRVLGDQARAPASAPDTALSRQLAELMPADGERARLIEYMERMDFQPGDAIIRQGGPADALYFVASGELSVFLEFEHGEPVRLRKVGAGAIMGELGLYLGGSRSASVVAEEASTVYRLSMESLERVERDEPAVAAAFHRCIARVVAERLVAANQNLSAMLR